MTDTWRVTATCPRCGDPLEPGATVVVADGVLRAPVTCGGDCQYRGRLTVTLTPDRGRH